MSSRVFASYLSMSANGRACDGEHGGEAFPGHTQLDGIAGVWLRFQHGLHPTLGASEMRKLRAQKLL